MSTLWPWPALEAAELRASTAAQPLLDTLAPLGTASWVEVAFSLNRTPAGTPDAGWVEAFDGGYISPPTGQWVLYSDGITSDASPSGTWSPVATYIAIGVEIRGTAEAVSNHTGAADLIGSGTVAATGSRKTFGAAAIAGTGTISASGSITGADITGVAAVSGTGTIVVLIAGPSVVVLPPQTFEEALAGSHRVRSTIHVYDTDETDLGVFTAVVSDGQIDVDGDADISRSLSLTLTDPLLKFSFEPMGDVYADKHLAVTYGVYVTGVGWVDTPVFRGPVSRYSRDGHEVSLEAVGKESLLMAPVKQLAVPQPTDRTVVNYIRTVTAAYGETLFDLGTAAGRLVPKSFTLDPSKAREKGTWWYLRQLADSVNMQLLYDGRGYLTLRPYRPDTVIHTFSDVLSEPTVGFDLTNARNRVQVFGPDDNGKDVMKGQSDLWASHPLSARSLGRNGHPRILLEQIKLDNAKLTFEQAYEIADRVLRQRSQQVVDVQVDSLPIPHLEVGDTCRLLTDAMDTQFTLKKFSLPLGPASMSVGYTRPQPVARYRSIRRRVR